MRIPITDLMEDCFPQDADTGCPDEVLADRIKTKVRKEMNKRNKRLHSIRRTILIAAVLLLLGGIVIATTVPGMQVREVPEDEIVSQNVTVIDPKGVAHTNKLFYDNAQSMLSFEVSDEPHHVVSLAPGWLPAQPDGIYSHRGEQTVLFAEQGISSDDPEFTGPWDYENSNLIYRMMPCALAEGPGMPYRVEVLDGNAVHGLSIVVQGSMEVVKQDTWNGLDRFEFSVDFTEHNNYQGTYEPDLVHYLLLFSKEEGYLVIISGVANLDVLEKIAENLEIVVEDALSEEEMRENHLMPLGLAAG